MRHYKTLPLCALGLLLCGQILAQAPKITWGKIPKEDLAMTVYDKDTSASAVVLFDVGDLYFDFSRGNKYVFERHTRIKILKRAGFDYANVAIYYLLAAEVKGIKAQIFLPDGTKLAVDKKDFFEEKRSKGVGAKTFAFPNVQEGAIIEYKYNLESDFISSLEEWYFQRDIPVQWSEYKLAIPEWFDYVQLYQGRKLDIADVSDNRKTINYNVNINNPSERAEYVELPTKMYYHNFAMKDVPALKMEAYSTTQEDYLARIQFQLKTITWPQSYPRPIMSTWPDVAKLLYEDDLFGHQFLRKSNYNSIWAEAAPLLEGLGTGREKIQRLYDFVSAQMTWDQNYGMQARQSLNKCFDEKRGSSAEINLMLLALLKEAGIEAWPALSSTRNHGKMMELYPIVSQFNYTMVVAEADGQLIVLDAGHIFRPMNHPRVAALNGQAWLVNPDNPQWFDLKSAGSNTIAFLKGTLDDGVLTGELKAKYDGYDAIDHRTQSHQVDPKTYWTSQLTERGLEAELTAVKVENQQDVSKWLTLEAAVAIEDVVQSGGARLYLSPVLMPAFSENPFKLTERSYPVEIPYPIAHQFVLQLAIPAGYTVEESPANLNLVLPERGGSFTYALSTSGNIINVNVKFRIDQLNFSPEEYVGLKTFFDMMLAKQAEQIVLKKG